MMNHTFIKSLWLTHPRMYCGSLVPETPRPWTKETSFSSEKKNSIYYLVLRKLTYVKWSNAHYKLLKLQNQVKLEGKQSEQTNIQTQIKCSAFMLKV